MKVRVRVKRRVLEEISLGSTNVRLKAILDTIDPAYGKVLIEMSFVLLDGFFEQKGRLFAT